MVTPGTRLLEWRCGPSLHPCPRAHAGPLWASCSSERAHCRAPAPLLGRHCRGQHPSLPRPPTCASRPCTRGAHEAGSEQEDARDTSSSDSGSGDTGSGDTGSSDTSSGDTGSGDTGSSDTSSGDTGSGNTGSGDGRVAHETQTPRNVQRC